MPKKQKKKPAKKPANKSQRSRPSRRTQPLWRRLLPAAIAVLLVGLVVLFVAYVSGQEPAATPPTAEVPATPQPRASMAVDETPGEVKTDIQYCRDQSLDLYEPRSIRFERSPVVIYLHGGGWSANNKASEPDQLAMIDGLRDSGYTIVSIDYGKVPAAYYPTAVQDSLCAVRFLRDNAERYFLSRDSIAAYGFSAGGYLAAQIGVLSDDSVFETSEYANRSSRINAVVTLAGLFDFTGGLTPGNRERIARFLNGANIQSAQVVVNVSKDDPPFLLLHGSNDQNVPTEQSARLEAVLRRESVPVQTILVANAEHGLNPSGGNPVPSRQEVSAAMARFIQDALEGDNTGLVPINTQ